VIQICKNFLQKGEINENSKSVEKATIPTNRVTTIASTKEHVALFILWQ